MVQVEGHPHPQHHTRVGLLRGQVGPPRSPMLNRQHDIGELATRLGGLVSRAGAVRLGTDLQHAGALQLPQPLGEQTTRQAWGAVSDLVEGPATQDDDVAEDDHGPALR